MRDDNCFFTSSPIMYFQLPYDYNYYIILKTKPFVTITFINKFVIIHFENNMFTIFHVYPYMFNSILFFSFDFLTFIVKCLYLFLYYPYVFASNMIPDQHIAFGNYVLFKPDILKKIINKMLFGINVYNNLCINV